ncbi:hypothetical protein AXF42_Ash001283 [Apostasia shenzhenica]|uniref:FLZ-type domain-containing protein n=1 Tax=Apostasia shenzhenica TaxID=1088818 RepID=A0A2I0AUG4_9ASPA|nr:hypothetical protein AXF42_Ash001283 [Apostasia shenzhenica]
MDRSSLSSTSCSAASLFCAVDLEAGFSDGRAAVVFSALHRRRTYRALAPLVPEPARARLFSDDLPDDEHHHFLDSCFLCKKPLADNLDIFMYRGDVPFCSEECRQEQIAMDEAREMNRKFAIRKEKQVKHTKSSSTPRSQKIHVRAGTVVAG